MTREFTTLIKTSDAFKKLENDILAHSIKQSYLFVSSDKTALRVLTNLFVVNVLIDESGGDKEAIEEAVFNGTHADVMFLGRNEKATVVTHEVDELINSAYFRPSKGSKRFFVIDNGETMNSSCQNKLLKTLEEPPSTAYIIILTDNLNAMLPTIVSRCDLVKPSPFDTDGILRELEIYYPNNQGLDVAAAASGGSIDAALKLLSGRRGLTLFNVALDALEGLSSSKGVLNASYKMTGIKEMASDFVDFNELIFRDLMFMHENLTKFCQLKMFAERLENLKKMFSYNAVINILPLFVKARQRLKFYGNINSIADEMYFSMAQIKAQY